MAEHNSSCCWSCPPVRKRVWPDSEELTSESFAREVDKGSTFFELTTHCLTPSPSHRRGLRSSSNRCPTFPLKFGCAIRSGGGFASWSHFIVSLCWVFGLAFRGAVVLSWSYSRVQGRLRGRSPVRRVS
ncbi:hypothetical protein CSUI_005128 [Cystoisospora suis]|uniref:Transmembrane protein n=1 Tax=Cystoisospora suis TaxID=483139 RepID=A0A2C6KYR3_9APIC|nr:hypothetical protein CSUI_005128 [Cystoisospora suis]